VDSFAFSYPRYLTAKESVDERALNGAVSTHFLRRLTEGAPERIAILEAGGGTGATLRRLLRRLDETTVSAVDYTLIEARGDNLETARASLREWASSAGYRVRADGPQVRLDRAPGPVDGLSEVRVTFRQGDLFEVVSADGDAGSYDAVVAQALLDIVDVERALRVLGSVLRRGGLWYLPIHFDGVTTFEPRFDPEVDAMVQRVYHDSMPAPEAGRRILTRLRQLGAELREVGASDWVVFGGRDGYREDEKYFLQCIINFVVDEISADDRIPDSVVDEWAAHRWHQIETGTLIYIAHQIDICAQRQ